MQLFRLLHGCGRSSKALKQLQQLRARALEMKVVISEDLSDSGLRNPDLLRIEVCWCSLEISAWQLMALMKAVT